MPSPFPGMDPFVEMQEWEDFHSRFNLAVADAIQPLVRPKYVVRVERRVYVDRPDDQVSRVPDIVLASTERGDLTSAPEASTVVGGTEPVICMLPMPMERRETYLVIRDRDSMEVVTVIETLSPANKRRHGNGRREYLHKREEVLNSSAHLVEFNLLRGGERLPMQDGLPPASYYAIVSRGNRRPEAAVVAWTIRDSMPAVPVPLLPDDADVLLPLQRLFNEVYDRGAYELSLNYEAEVAPPFEAAEAQWVIEQLQSRSRVDHD